MKAQIHPDLALLAHQIDHLTPDPRNARLHDRRNIDAVKMSYQAHGQLKAIVVQKISDDGTPMVVRAGNGQVEAAKELGWTHIAAVVIDVKDAEAVAFAIRDNRTAELAEWDWKVVAGEMASFDQAGQSFGDLGFSESEMAPLRETTWFAEATGNLEDHTRSKPDADEKESRTIKLDGDDARDFSAALAVMLERFPESKENLSRAVGRMARHYLATLTHSQAPKN